MKRNTRVFITAFVTVGLFMFCFSSFAEYAWLCGKWAELHGPLPHTHIGVSLDEKTCDRLMSVLATDDYGKFDELLLRDHRILRVENNSKVVVLDTRIFEGKARVVVFTGLYKGMSGWVPIEWLDHNETRPRLSSVK